MGSLGGTEEWREFQEELDTCLQSREMVKVTEQ